jgi:hypothetical protein
MAIIKTKGELSITRDSHNIITITIGDSESLSAEVVVKMDCETFAKAVTGLSMITVDATWRNTDRAGKKREMFEVKIPKEDLPSDRAVLGDFIKSWLETREYLVDGWMIHSNGIGTQQRGESHHVHLVRFVDGSES